MIADPADAPSLEFVEPGEPAGGLPVHGGGGVVHGGGVEGGVDDSDGQRAGVPFPAVPSSAQRTVRAREHLFADVSSEAQGHVPDEVLARRAGLGDKTAFAALAQRHGPSLYRLLIRMLDDHAAVDDCLQETLLAAWRSLHGFRGEAGVRTWLFTIARRQAYAYVRRVPQSGSMPYVDPEEVLGQIADLRADPARTSVDAALLQAIDVALKLLPEQQRSAWILKEVEGLTYAEIATVLDVSPTTVRGLLARGRATLAEALEEWR